VMEVDAVCRPAAVGQAGDGGGCRLGRTPSASTRK
jgi:hypothetical protein